MRNLSKDSIFSEFDLSFENVFDKDNNLLDNASNFDSIWVIFLENYSF